MIKHDDAVGFLFAGVLQVGRDAFAVADLIYHRAFRDANAVRIVRVIQKRQANAVAFNEQRPAFFMIVGAGVRAEMLETQRVYDFQRAQNTVFEFIDAVIVGECENVDAGFFKRFRQRVRRTELRIPAVQFAIARQRRFEIRDGQIRSGQQMFDRREDAVEFVGLRLRIKSGR